MDDYYKSIQNLSSMLGVVTGTNNMNKWLFGSCHKLSSKDKRKNEYSIKIIFDSVWFVINRTQINQSTASFFFVTL